MTVSLESKYKGLLFSLMAAIVNSSIGIANEFSFAGSDFQGVAFFKTVVAFIICGSLCLLLNLRIPLNKITLIRCAIVAFFGIFTLYFFETLAFSMAPVSVVSFSIYAAGIIGLFLSSIILKEELSINKIAAIFLVVIGIYLMTNAEIEFSSGVLFALLGGLGYSLYLILTKHFAIPSGLPMLTLMFFFGSLYLAVPFFYSGAHFPTSEAIPGILWLSIVPTIFGFYFTNAALSHLDAGLVQIVETSDPLFASLFALLILNQTISSGGYVGCALIFMALIVAALPKKLSVVLS